MLDILSTGGSKRIDTTSVTDKHLEDTRNTVKFGLSDIVLK